LIKHFVKDEDESVVDYFIDKLDNNKDGKIDFVEFKALMTNESFDFV